MCGVLWKANFKYCVSRPPHNNFLYCTAQNSLPPPTSVHSPAHLGSPVPPRPCRPGSTCARTRSLPPPPTLPLIRSLASALSLLLPLVPLVPAGIPHPPPPHRRHRPRRMRVPRTPRTVWRSRHCSAMCSRCARVSACNATWYGRDGAGVDFFACLMLQCEAPCDCCMGVNVDSHRSMRISPFPKIDPGCIFAPHVFLTFLLWHCDTVSLCRCFAQTSDMSRSANEATMHGQHAYGSDQVRILNCSCLQSQLVTLRLRRHI